MRFLILMLLSSFAFADDFIITFDLPPTGAVPDSFNLYNECNTTPVLLSSIASGDTGTVALNPLATQYMCVNAVNENGPSPFSNIVRLGGLPHAPLNLQFQCADAGCSVVITQL